MQPRDDVATYWQRESKQSDEGKLVILYQDAHDGSWFVGGDDGAVAPVPLGAFESAGAARRWADGRFHGGTWHPDHWEIYRV